MGSCGFHPCVAVGTVLRRSDRILFDLRKLCGTREGPPGTLVTASPGHTGWLPEPTEALPGDPWDLLEP